MDVSKDFYGNLILGGIEIDKAELLGEIDSEDMLAELKDRGEYMDVDEMVTYLVDGDEEPKMLEAIEPWIIVREKEVDDLLAEMYSDEIVDYLKRHSALPTEEKTLDDFGYDEILSELSRRGTPVIEVTPAVADAFELVSQFLSVATMDTENLTGERFLLTE